MLDPDMYGDTLTFNGNSIACLSPNTQQKLAMKQTNYEMQIPGTFSLRVADFNSSGITVRSFFQQGGDTFQVVSINADDVDASVDLNAVYKQ
jgi:hypothetical protein